MRITLLSLASLLLSVTAIACAAAAPNSGSRAPVPAMAPPAATAAPAAADAARKSLAGSAPSSADSFGENVPSAANVERMIVYNVNLSLEVADTDQAVNDISAAAAQYKGYVSASNLNRDSQGMMRGTITLRIPAESLDAAQKQIEAVGLKVLSRNKSSSDVTDQYTDLNARLTNLEATRDDLRKMLDSVTEKSGKAEDLLAVYNQLSAVQGQIEQIKGQMNVIDNTTSLATLTIELTPHQEVQIVEPETWMPNQTAAQALRALVQAAQGLINLAIWLTLFLLPILILLALPFAVLALVIRSIVRRRSTPKAAAPAK